MMLPPRQVDLLHGAAQRRESSVRPLLAALLVAVLATPTRGETPVAQAARQFREYCLHERVDRGERLLDDVELPKTNPAQAEQLLAALREDGSWPDVDYAAHARSSWPACTHLTRVLGLAAFARRADTPEAARAACLAGIHRALACWKQHDYRCPNWWYNDIGVPKILGMTALLLDADLADDERKYIADGVLARAKVGTMTGQNRVWVAANGILRAMLLADEALMRPAVAVVQEELRVGTGEGIQADESFHQHGPQQQFGNYGLAYAVEMSRWATVLRGTPWAFPEDKLEVLRDYLLAGQNWVTWCGLLDISSCGRQLSPGSPPRKAGVLRSVMRVMAAADPGHAREYLAFDARNREDTTENDLVGTRYFWRSDYLVQRRPAFMATLKLSSNRVIGGETVNGENLSGLHLADGATYFYRGGHEYDDIFPAWDWRLVPGVTCLLDHGSLTWPKSDYKKGTEFVGGVTDGASGCAALDFRRGDLRARKAWFYVGDTVVCLGTDINSAGDQPVVTTLNQCLLKTAVTVQRAGQRATVSGADQDLAGADWVEQDGWRYRLLAPAAWKVSAASRTGNWRTVFDNPATPKPDVSRDVFTLWLEHGTRVNAAGYAYSVAPAAGVDAAAAPEVLSNTGEMQAVRSKTERGDWLGAVFWSAGDADFHGLAVRVDTPCLVLLDAGRVSVSDPTQKAKSLRLEVNHRAVTVELPQGADAGKTVEVPGISSAASGATNPGQDDDGASSTSSAPQ